MKLGLVCAVLLGAVAPASADVFVFKDLDGYEKCLQTDHLVEKVKTDSGSQARFLSQSEIQERCAQASVKVLTGAKNKDLTMQFIQSTKRLSWPENSLDQIDVLTNLSLPACNEMAVYEVLLKALAAPRDHNVNFTRTKAIVKRCLKDKDFKKDFLEEKDSGDATVAANACSILLEEKLVKACKENK